MLNETADMFHISKRYTDYRMMIDEIKPDIVSVCTPNRFHAEQTIYALTHNAHVLCEKPPALCVDELIAMNLEARKHQRILAFNLHHRYRLETVKMQQWVAQQGKSNVYFGEVFALRRRGVPGWGSFTQKSLAGGGPLIDLGVHMLDLALYILDFPPLRYVTATMSNRIGKLGGLGDFGPWDGASFSVEDSLFGQIVFQDGTSLQIQTAFTHHMTEKSKMNIKLYATQEAIELSPLRIVQYDQVKQEESIPFPVGLCVHPYFLRKIKGEKLDIPDGQSVLMIQQVIDALYQSAMTNQPIFINSLD
jgi:predicted dehydrogenase